MILPVIAYGDPVLRKICKNIDKDFPDLMDLIENMFETMTHSYGVGLAAPQIGKAIRLFVIDTAPFAENDDLTPEEREELQGFKKVFINARILEESGEPWRFNEGCLSVPGINEEVERLPDITIEYYDENFKKHTDKLSGLKARVVQHEYDHIEGIIFTDRISSFKKRILKRKIENISKGKVDVDYAMKFPKRRKK